VGSNKALDAGRYADVADRFASVWLLNGNTICVIHANPMLKSFEEWLPISESLFG
jgi:hypothetical protein